MKLLICTLVSTAVLSRPEAKTGPHTRRYSELYIPDLRRRQYMPDPRKKSRLVTTHVNKQMNGWTSEGITERMHQ